MNYSRTINTFFKVSLTLVLFVTSSKAISQTNGENKVVGMNHSSNSNSLKSAFVPASAIKEEMENAYPMAVPLEVEIGKGDNWLEAH